MELNEALDKLNKDGFICEEMEWGSEPKFYASKTPVEDEDDEDEVSPVAAAKIKELAQRLSDAGFKLKTGIGWAGPFISLRKTKIGHVAIVYEDDNDCFTVECDDGSQVYLNSDYEEDFQDFVGFLNGENNF